MGTVDHEVSPLMNTYDLYATVLVRYDPRYTNVVGKWMLNASNAIKFLSHRNADEHQPYLNKSNIPKGDRL
jgi:hypothetical protein